jgi:hypothetical protein
VDSTERRGAKLPVLCPNSLTDWEVSGGVVIFTTPSLGIAPKSFDIGSQVVLSKPVIDLPLKKPKKTSGGFLQRLACNDGNAIKTYPKKSETLTEET